MVVELDYGCPACSCSCRLALAVERVSTERGCFSSLTGRACALMALTKFSRWSVKDLPVHTSTHRLL